MLRESGACSRADLVRALGLSAPTITNVVRDLLAMNLIEPLGEGDSSGGRPPDMIRFKAERGCMLAVQVTAASLAFLLSDLDGNELSRHSEPLLPGNKTPESVCALIHTVARGMLRRQKKTREQLLALIVGVPAIADAEKGIVLSISTLDQWRSVPLRTMLAKYFKCLILIENDTNLAALGEQFKGAAQGYDSFVFISIGANVSAGIILENRIHHGVQWSAGEIAYLRLPHVSRRKPAMHEFGALEDVLTEAGIVRDWQEARTGAHAKYSKNPSAASVLDLAKAGDALATQVVRVRADIVADIVINLSLILNPGLILLGGAVGGHGALVSLVRQQLEESEFAVPKLEVGALGEAAILWGAIAAGLEEIPSVLIPDAAV